YFICERLFAGPPVTGAIGLRKCPDNGSAAVRSLLKGTPASIGGHALVKYRYRVCNIHGQDCWQIQTEQLVFILFKANFLLPVINRIHSEVVVQIKPYFGHTWYSWLEVSGNGTLYVTYGRVYSPLGTLVNYLVSFCLIRWT